MVTYGWKHCVRTFVVESGDRFAKGRAVQEADNQGLAESPLEVICVDNVKQYANPRCTGALVRQMLGAGHELVAAQARKRSNHGRQMALVSMAASPGGQALA